MNKMGKMLSTLDEFNYRLTCGAKLVGAVHEAMSHSVNDPEVFHDALFGAYMFLRDMSDELAEIVQAQYEEGAR